MIFYRTLMAKISKKLFSQPLFRGPFSPFGPV